MPSRPQAVCWDPWYTMCLTEVGDGAGSDEHGRLRERRFISEQNCFISGRKAPLSYHARTPTIWPLIDNSACGSASLCSASLDNMWTCILHNVARKQTWLAVCLSGRAKLHKPFTQRTQPDTNTQSCWWCIIIILRPSRVTWLSLNYPLLLKNILSGYLDYPMMHFISTESNNFHDDNAPLHKAQVVTECFEWHDNDVSHMPLL